MAARIFTLSPVTARRAARLMGCGECHGGLWFFHEAQVVEFASDDPVVGGTDAHSYAEAYVADAEGFVHSAKAMYDEEHAVLGYRPADVVRYVRHSPSLGGTLEWVQTGTTGDDPDQVTGVLKYTSMPTGSVVGTDAYGHQRLFYERWCKAAGVTPEPLEPVQGPLTQAEAEDAARLADWESSMLHPDG